ncbi:hypothetical protein [Bifidobacterium aquikefiri]|nr:hypothetical protein [Bifidobacterium aquikefiri]
METSGEEGLQNPHIVIPTQIQLHQVLGIALFVADGCQINVTAAK